MSLESLWDPSLRLEGGEEGELSHRQMEESSADDRRLYSNGLLLDANSGAVITLLSPPRFLTGALRLACVQALSLTIETVNSPL